MAVGRSHRTASIEVTAEEITAFAGRYDPQPFHLDDAAGKQSVFGGLVASGWMTAGLTMRMIVMSEFGFGTGAIGLGVETLRWPRPVRPGDVLTANVEVIAARASKSQPAHGIVKLRTTTTNQRGEPVQVMLSNVLVRRRYAGM